MATTWSTSRAARSPRSTRLVRGRPRVETTATVWMGMTMGCARCHDHKYDPIPQRDFYRFFAFFNTIDEKGLDGREGNAEPMLRLPAPDYEQRRADLERRLEQARGAVSEYDATLEQLEWERTALETIPAPPEQGLIARYGSMATSQRRRAWAQDAEDFTSAKLGKGLSLGEQEIVLDRTARSLKPF
ncbi:MAG: DUF1549 domain-containing protein [Bryobacterales bacterium]